ncbi:ABC transporter permease [Desulfosporosinus sp.]|uniref:ABC transporter permease n=1 Tax=Desulfosporosinus sp. TaxID=157907 RepID=UPI000E818A70|nr:ABC transporter permease [Desulfosporosinus sp.]MBC2723984.1 ABC transporter permease [Desulfosporosinus sp.]MBC2728360.1 ABC transporter permease [Desulfosporosinus sp.]HBV87283.1 ABC transporter permease [Desulfosporosinus sp.]
MSSNYNGVFKQIMVLISALVGALLVGALFLLLAKSDPVKAYGVMFSGPFSDKFGITETLVRAVPLLLVGLGIVISFRSGIINIGAEGQILAGAIGATAVATSLPDLPAVMLLPLVFLAGATCGGLWGGIAGWLKARLSVNEILSTVMLNQIALQIYLFLIRGPLIDPKEVSYGTGVPQTALIPEHIWLSKLIPGTRIHSGLIFALLLAVLVYVFLWKTSSGYRMRAVGAGPEAARYAGIRVEWYLVLAMALAGGMAGLAGVVEVAGVHHRSLEGLSAGYGFSGIVAALFGRLHPLGTIPASVLFGALLVGADMMQRAVNIPAAMIMVIQGLVVLFVVSSDYFLQNPDFGARIKAKLFGEKADGEGGK